MNFWDAQTLASGTLGEIQAGFFPAMPPAIDTDRPPAWDDDMRPVGRLIPGSQVIILDHPSSGERSVMFVQILDHQLGKVWARACDVKKLET